MIEGMYWTLIEGLPTVPTPALLLESRIQNPRSVYIRKIFYCCFFTLLLLQVRVVRREKRAHRKTLQAVHIWNSNSLFARLFSFRTLGFYFLQKLLLVKLPSRLGKTPCGTACMDAAVGQPIDPTCCTDVFTHIFWHTTYHMFLLFYWPIIEGQ